jgi:hypothetical protein
MSRNTIGWAIQGESWVCVYGELNCSFEQAIRYDLNYFRQTPPNRDIVAPATTSTRAFRDSSLDTFSLIIEADTRITQAPPPGF